jgi:hypothetical protein
MTFDRQKNVSSHRPPFLQGPRIRSNLACFQKNPFPTAHRETSPQFYGLFLVRKPPKKWKENPRIGGLCVRPEQYKFSSTPIFRRNNSPQGCALCTSSCLQGLTLLHITRMSSRDIRLRFQVRCWQRLQQSITNFKPPQGTLRSRGSKAFANHQRRRFTTRSLKRSIIALYP